jgi:hypothetical protein
MNLELLKPHTHAGKRCATGARLVLPEGSAGWLIAQGIAKTVEEITDARPTRRELATPSTPASKGD